MASSSDLSHQPLLDNNSESVLDSEAADSKTERAATETTTFSLLKFWAGLALDLADVATDIWYIIALVIWRYSVWNDADDDSVMAFLKYFASLLFTIVLLSPTLYGVMSIWLVYDLEYRNGAIFFSEGPSVEFLNNRKLFMVLGVFIEDVPQLIIQLVYRHRFGMPLSSIVSFWFSCVGVIVKLYQGSYALFVFLADYEFASDEEFVLFVYAWVSSPSKLIGKGHSRLALFYSLCFGVPLVSIVIALFFDLI